MNISAIGHVGGGRAEAIDDDWDSETAVIELAPGFGPEALFGLTDFSHVEIIFQFDQVPLGKIETGARHRVTAPTGRWSASSHSVARTGPIALA
jgi:tRNA (Thr-GGU) A37 N-methylase